MKNFSVKIQNKEFWISRSVACACFIFKEIDGNLYALIEKRGRGAADSKHKWCCVCGYLDYDETCEECCKRESIEECGFSLNINRLKFMKVNSSPSENQQNVTLHYVYFADNNETFNVEKAVGGEKNEVEEVKWQLIGHVDKEKLSVNIFNIMAIDWAFDHEIRILEHLSKFYQLKME